LCERGVRFRNRLRRRDKNFFLHLPLSLPIPYLIIDLRFDFLRGRCELARLRPQIVKVLFARNVLALLFQIAAEVRASPRKYRREHPEPYLRKCRQRHNVSPELRLNIPRPALQWPNDE